GGGAGRAGAGPGTMRGRAARRSALQCDGDRLGQRGGRPAGQAGQVAAVDDQLAPGDGGVHARVDRGHRLGQARTGQDAGQLLDGDRTVGDLLAGLPAQLGRVLGEAPRLVAAQLVGPVLVALAGEHGDGGGRVVGARGGGDPAVTGGGDDRVVLQHGRQVLGVHLVVPAVAQQRV